MSTRKVDPTRTYPAGHALEGEPMPARQGPHLGVMRRDDPHDMAATKHARDRVMGRKFMGGAPGAGLHGDEAGDVPGGGSTRGASTTGSVLPVVAASRQISKPAEQWTHLLNQGQIIAPPYDPWLLVCAVEESDTLPSLIDAMAVNMTGFGHELIPLFPTRDEETGEPIDAPPEAEAEHNLLELFMASANLELGTLGVFLLVDRDVEITGNGYMEVLRDAVGQVSALEHVPSWTMRLGALSQPQLVEVPFRHPSTGDLIRLRRYRRFRTFVQVRDGRIAYFKQYGDPRFINWKTGEYRAETWGQDTNGNALDGTEVVHRRIYAAHSPYGVPRWIGTMPHVRAGRSAGELVVSWFVGAPIGAKMAMVSGGTWNADSFDKAVGRIDDMARGAENAWSLVVLEAEAEGSSGDMLDDSTVSAPRMALEDLAYELPSELYYGDGNLIDGSQRRVARSFRLPPVYWGGSDDFSRAAANTARAMTEEQVFVPERRIRWLQWLNGELLPSMGINFWALGLLGANTTDDAETAKGLAGFVQGGGASPNQLIRLFNAITKQDTPPIAEPWGDRPLALTQALVQQGLDPNMPLADTVADGSDQAAGDGQGDKGPDLQPDAGAGIDAPAQDTALNGAQVSAALAIVQEVVAGGLTEAMAEAMLIEFFNLSKEASAAILADAASLRDEQDPVPDANDQDPFGNGAQGVDDGAQGGPAPARKARKGASMIRRLDRLAQQLEADLAESNPHWRG